jgi:hypothetical protein
VRRPEAKLGLVLLGVEIVDGSGCCPYTSFNYGRSNVFGSAIGSQVNAEGLSILETLEANAAVDNVPHTTNKREALIVVLLFKDEDTSFAIGAILLGTEGNDGKLDLGDGESHSSFEGKAGVAKAMKCNVFETESLGTPWRLGNGTMVMSSNWAGWWDHSAR